MTLGMNETRGPSLCGISAWLKTKANGVRLNGLAIKIGIRMRTKKIVDTGVHGGIRGPSEDCMTDDGKGEKVLRTPRSIKIGTITELVHRGPNLARMEPLGVVIWWALGKILKVMDTWWVRDGILQYVHAILRTK